MINTSCFTVSSVITGDSKICIEVQHVATIPHLGSTSGLKLSGFYLFLPNLRDFGCAPDRNLGLLKMQKKTFSFHRPTVAVGKVMVSLE